MKEDTQKMNFQRTENEEVIFADAQGRELHVPKTVLAKVMLNELLQSP